MAIRKNNPQEDFFTSFQTGAELRAKQQQLQVNRAKVQLDFITDMMKHQADTQKLQTDMMKNGINPTTHQPMQRGAFNPFTGEQQDVFYDQGTPGNAFNGAGPGASSPMAIAKGPVKIPALRPDQLETDNKGRTFVNLDNGVRMPALITIGPGGRITGARTYSPAGKEVFMALMSQFGDQRAPSVTPKKGAAPPAAQIATPLSFEEANQAVDNMIMQGTPLQTILNEIQKDPEILPGHKIRLKALAQQKFRGRKRQPSGTP